MNERKPGHGNGHDGQRPSARPRSGNGRPAPAPAPNAPGAHDAAEPTRIQQPIRAQRDNGYDEAGGAPRAAKPKKKKGKIKRSTVIKVMVLNVFKALFVMLCIGAMIGGVAAVQVVQYAVESTENDESLLDLENYKMNQTSYFMAYNPDNPNAREDDDYILYQELVGDEDRIWVDISDIPDDLINAVVATEDREFHNHRGVNFRRTVLALVNEVVQIDAWKGGASTIDQQLVKNITKDDVVVGDDGDRTEGYKRKLREIFRAMGLRNRYSEDMILEAYLNTIGLSERIAGVGAGAKRYFNKEVQDLTLTECATIAGITQKPTAYSPIQNPEGSLKRRNDVLEFMYQCEYITKQERDEAWEQPLGLNRGETTKTNAGIFSYASDKAYNDVIEDLVNEKGYSYAGAKQYLYNGGLRVYLTVDLRVQEALDNIMVTGYDEGGFFMNEERFPGYVRSLTVAEEIKNDMGQVVGTQNVLPQVAVAVVNYDGELIATNGGIGEKTASLSLNRSIGTVVPDENSATGYRVEGTVRQTGSSMKPIAAYALGIDYGIITYSKMVKDEGVQPKNPLKPSRNAETGAIVKDWPSNYGATRHTKIPIVSAVAESTNTVACQVGLWVGLEQMYEFLVDTLQIGSLVDPADLGLGPLVLGSQTFGMSPYELAGAYTMFGGNDTYGVFNSLHSYSRVEDARGNIVLEPPITTVQAIDPQSGYIMNKLLSNVLTTSRFPGGASPTAGGMTPEGEMPAAGKTGTTSDDNDRWFVGLTPYYVTAVWWGYDQDHTLLNRWSPGARTNIPVNVWKALMEDVQADLEVKDFPEQPDGIEVARFCTSSGDLARPGCPGNLEGYYHSEFTPEECMGHEGVLEEGEEAPPPA